MLLILASPGRHDLVMAVVVFMLILSLSKWQAGSQGDVQESKHSQKQRN
jgi:hypothetical protein